MRSNRKGRGEVEDESSNDGSDSEVDELVKQTLAKCGIGVGAIPSGADVHQLCASIDPEWATKLAPLRLVKRKPGPCSKKKQE